MPSRFKRSPVLKKKRPTPKAPSPFTRSPGIRPKPKPKLAPKPNIYRDGPTKPKKPKKPTVSKPNKYKDGTKPKKATAKGKLPGIVTGALARKKAGLRHKLTEGYDKPAQAHVKRKRAKR